MKVRVRRAGEPYHLLGVNPAGQTASMDSTSDEDVPLQGPSPVELVLMALGGCTGIDVLSFLKKMRGRVDAFELELDAQREPDKVPSLFTAIHVHYVLEGALEAAQVRRAIELSLGTYCSVAKLLEKTASISYSFTLNGETFA
jgi:putative redox protein